MSQVGKYELTFSGNKDYTLTGSYVASSAVKVSFAKKFTIFPFYTPGAGGTGNTLQFQIQINPYNSAEDPNDLYWATVGQYNNSSGTITEEVSTYTSNNSTTASTLKAVTPIEFSQLSVQQIRVKAKETVGAGSAGVARFVVDQNYTI